MALATSLPPLLKRLVQMGAPSAARTRGVQPTPQSNETTRAWKINKTGRCRDRIRETGCIKLQSVWELQPIGLQAAAGRLSLYLRHEFPFVKSRAMQPVRPPVLP